MDRTEVKLGKIEHVSFGLGGYQGAMIGLHFAFSGDGWGCGTSNAAWDANRIKCSEHAEWTEEDRSMSYSGIMRKLSDLLAQAKVESVSELEGVPVEVTFNNNMLQSWRILS